MVEVAFADYFGIQEYWRLSQALQDTDQQIVVDLTEVKSASVAGVVPSVALLTGNRLMGRETEVLLGHCDLWDATGWRNALTRSEFHQAPEAPQITTYSDFEVLTRAVDSARDYIAATVDCAPGVIDAVIWTLNELGDNVLIHSVEKPDVPVGFLQVLVRDDRSIEFSVADYGRGIRESLQSGVEVASDIDALMKAIQKGVTRDKSVGQGNGLSGSVRICQATAGRLYLMSGFGAIEVRGDVPIERSTGHIMGSIVAITLKVDQEIDLAIALWGTPPAGAWEIKYLMDDDDIRFVVAEEATGFGTRDMGRALRTRLLNVMKDHPTAHVMIDFDGVPLASASFCDEFVAKLIVELGGMVTAYSRIGLTGMSVLVQRTIDSVVPQRLVEAGAATEEE